MKLRPVSERNLLGLNTPELKFHYAVHTLKGGTLPNSTQAVIKPAQALVPAVIGNGTAANPQFPAIPARAAVRSPIVKPLPEWIGSVIHENPYGNQILDRAVLYLPYSPAAIALGVDFSVALIEEITPPKYDLGAWLGSLSGIIPSTESEFLVNGAIGSVEQFAYANALLLPAVDGYTNTIESSLYKPTPLHPGIPAIKIDVHFFIPQHNFYNFEFA